MMTRLASLVLVTIAIVLGVALLGVALAQADDVGGVAGSIFDSLDANRDGVISLDEVKAARGRMFDKIDTDGDGVATVAEIEAAKAAAQKRTAMRLANIARLRAAMPAPSERLEALDQNHDGKVSRDEFVAASPWFDRIGASGGRLTKVDFAKFLDAAR